MKKIINLLATLAAGFSLGILFAPKKGKELRKSLSESDNKFNQFTDVLITAGKDASKEVKKFLAKDDVQNLINKGKTHAGDLLKKLKEGSKDLPKKAQKELSSLVDKAKNAVKKKKKKKEVEETEEGDE